MKYIDKLSKEEFQELVTRIATVHLNCSEENIRFDYESKVVRCKSASTGKIVVISLDDFQANCSDKFVEKIATKEIIKFLFEKYGAEYINDFKEELKDDNFKSYIKKCVSNEQGIENEVFDNSVEKQ